MPTILIILIFVIVFAVLVGILLALFLPANWKTETDITVKATAKQVFHQINKSKNWQNWTVWSPVYDETIAIELGEEQDGLGAIQTWKNTQMNGIMTIVESKTDEAVQFHFDLESHRFIIYSRMILQPVDDQVKIIWTSKYSQEGINPFERLQGIALKKLMLNNKQISLSRLKSFLES